MNSRIRIARTNNLKQLDTDIKQSTKLADGQPFYDKDTKYIYIGKGNDSEDPSLLDYTKDDAVKSYTTNRFDNNRYLRIESNSHPASNYNDYLGPTISQNFKPNTINDPIVMRLPTKISTTINGSATRLASINESTNVVTNMSVGNSLLPVYFNNGVPVSVSGLNIIAENGNPIPVKIKSNNSQSYIDLSGSNSYIKVNGYIEANYFNATSDKRLKDNIKQSNINALDIIKNLDIVNFNFKDSINDTQIGIIAQQLLELDKNRFFIDDSGEYLKVKENKLIYLLLKAIKELIK